MELTPQDIEVTEEESAVIDKARIWLRRIYTDGADIRLDSIERDSIYDLVVGLGDIVVRHLSRPETLHDPKVIVRFWHKVTVTGGDSCWLWHGATQGIGYGSFYMNRRLTTAHRFSYELHFGPIPLDKWVLHECDNPPCCNPRHLFLGDRLSNAQDRSRKGRTPHGESSYRARLTYAQVVDIRERYASGSCTIYALAEEFGVHPATISKIINRKLWVKSGINDKFGGPIVDRPKPLSESGQMLTPVEVTVLAEKAHACEHDGICGYCGARSINGRCSNQFCG